MKKWGYCRVSDRSQNIETQVKQLEEYGVDEIIQESVSGVSKDKKLNDLVERMGPGDTLVVARMDRLGRSTRQLLELVEELDERKISLVFLDVKVDTSGPVGKYFLISLAGLAQLEREQLKEKQRRGIELAKQKGIYKGRMPKYTKNHKGLQHAFDLYDSKEYTVKEICEITRVSKSTLYRKLKEREAAVGGS